MINVKQKTKKTKKFNFSKIILHWLQSADPAYPELQVQVKGAVQFPFPLQLFKEEQSGVEQEEPVHPLVHVHTPLLQVPPFAQLGLQGSIKLI